jgi:hypothetical protein
MESALIVRYRFGAGSGYEYDERSGHDSRSVATGAGVTVMSEVSSVNIISRL